MTRAGAFFLLLAAPVLAGEPVPAQERYERLVAGNRVIVDQHLRLSIQSSEGPLLQSFGWRMQQARGDKILNPCDQSTSPMVIKESLDDQGRLVLSSPEAVSIPDGFKWSASTTFEKRAVRVRYSFTFLRDLPNTWIHVFGAIPGNTGFGRLGTGDGPRSVVFHTPSGGLTFAFSPEDLHLESHRPYLKQGIRLWLGQRERRKYGARPRFRKGETFQASIRILIPEPSGGDLPRLPLHEQVRIGFAENTTSPYWSYVPRETVELAVPIETCSARSSNVEAEWRLTDYWDRSVWSVQQQVELDGNPALPLTFPAPARFGPYRLTLALRRILAMGQTEMVSKDVAVLGVLNPSWASERFSSREQFLGATIHGGAGNHELARRFGIRWKRCEFEVSWTWNAWHPHQYTFSRQRINDMKLLGIEPMGQMAYCPPWGAKNAADEERDRLYGTGHKAVHHFLSYRMPDLDHFREYVENVTTFFRDDIRYWELWNEPNGPKFFQGGPDGYLRMLEVAQKVVKKNIPDGVLMGTSGAGFVGLDPWGQKLLELGAAKYLDVWSYHCYAHGRYFNADATHRDLRNLREVLDEHGGKHLRLWNTEGGSRDISMFRDAEKERWPPAKARPRRDPLTGFALPKLFTVELAEGVERHSFYFFKGGWGFDSLHSLEGTGAPRAVIYPVAAWAGILTGATFADRWTRDRLGYAYFFERQRTALAVLWADLAGGTSVPLAINPEPGLAAFDGLSNPLPVTGKLQLSAAPVYVEWPEHTVAELQAVIGWQTMPKLEHPELLAKRAQAPDLGLPLISDFNVVAEGGRGMLHPLDLRAGCNMGFVDPVQGDGKGGWSDEGPSNDFRGVTVGDREFYGVPVTLIDPATNAGMSVIALKSEGLPNGVEDVQVPVGRALRGLFVLHASQNYTRKGLVYTIALEYENGTTERIEVNAPGELNDTWASPDPELERSFLTKAVPMRVFAQDRALKEIEKEWLRKTGKDYVFRFPRLTWFENPRHDAGKVARIRVRSANPRGVPIIMAITVLGN